MWTGAPIYRGDQLRFALSLQLAIMATLVAVVLAIPLGIVSAIKQDTWVDYAVRIFSIAGLAMPSFWLGIVFILVLLITFQWLPPMVYTPFWVNPWQNLPQLIWPALAVGYRYSAVATRMTRSAMLEVLREDYIRTARAKGLVEKLILSRHALKNAMLPVVTVVASSSRSCSAASSSPSRCSTSTGSASSSCRRWPTATTPWSRRWSCWWRGFFIVVNFVMDISYAWLDPRIRYPVTQDMAISAPSDVTLAVEEAPSRSWLAGVREFAQRRPLGALGAAIVPS